MNRVDWPGVAACLLVSAIIAGCLWFTATAPGHFTPGCKKNPCKYHVIKPYKQALKQLRGCETRGLKGRARWRYNGVHQGAYQFAPSTWAATGSPWAGAHLAPRVEQSYRTVVLAVTEGWGHWPVCGRGLG